MIVAFGGQVCIPEKSAGVRRKMHNHGYKVIFVSLLRPNEKMHIHFLILKCIRSRIEIV